MILYFNNTEMQTQFNLLSVNIKQSDVYLKAFVGIIKTMIINRSRLPV